MARQRFSDEDDDRDDRPRRRDDDDFDRDDRRRDDDFEDRPRRRDDYEDDRPRGRAKPGLATAAGVLWVIWAAFELIGVIGAGINLANVKAAIQLQAGMNGVVIDNETTSQLTILGVFRLVLNLIAFILFLLAGIRTLSGGARSLGGYGWGTVVICIAFVVYCLAGAYILSGVFAKMGGPFAGGRADGILYGAMCGAGLLAISGSLLAGIFALSCNGKYVKWWDAVKGRRSDY